jgi:hypothetical protein
VDCDLERYPADIKIATSIDRKGVQRSHLTVEDKAYRLDGFNAIWDRSQAYTKVVEPVRLGMQAYIDAEARTFLDGLYYCAPQSFWLSAPPAARIAEIKVRQLQVAASLGLLIPDSCIGNARAPAHDLTRKYNVMAIKPLFRNVIEYEPSPWQKIERLLYEYRNRAVLEKVRHSNSIAHDHIRFKVQQRLPTRQFVREDAEPFFRSLPPCPVFLQEYVKKKLELRIVVVGGRVFSCAIRSQDGADDARVDYRGYEDGLVHEVYHLPSEIESKCIDVVRVLALLFGCIDMIVTPANEHVFLEVNAHGSWLWVQDRTGMPIAEALADLLVAHDGPATGLAQETSA